MVDSQANDLTVQWDYYGCTHEDEAKVAEYWRTHSQRLNGAVSALDDAAGPLNMVIEHDTENGRWRSQAALYTAGSVLVSEVEADRPEDVVEATIESLSGEVSRHLDQPATNRGIRDFSGLKSVLASLHQQGRSEGFMRLLLPLLASVGPYIRRELQVREIAGDVGPANTTPTDIMDDVLLEAWTAFPERDPNRDLHLWLLEVAERCLDRAEDAIRTVSLDDRVPVPSPNERNSRMDEWVEQVSYFDRVELARLLEAEGSVNAWDESTLEQTQRDLADLLRDMTRDQRQALILSAALGYSSNDIADFQNRTPSDVEASIDTASTKLRTDSRFEHLRDLEETMSRKDIRLQRKRHSAQR